MIVRLDCPICGLVDFDIDKTTYVIATGAVHADCGCGLELTNAHIYPEEIAECLAKGMELAVA